MLSNAPHRPYDGSQAESEALDLDDDLAPPVAPDVSSYAWSLTNHCCRICFSRIMQAERPGGGYFYRCTGCGSAGEGNHPKVICSCGLKIKTVTRREIFRGGRAGTEKVHGQRDMGVRCIVNDAVCPENPFEIVARQVDQSGR